MKTSVVITTIGYPNAAMYALSDGCAKHADYNFIIIGDRKTPDYFKVDGACFYSIKDKPWFEFTRVALENSYARKNIGYLIAMSRDSEIIIDADDDAIPRAAFWEERRRGVWSPLVTSKNGWVNAYSLFTTHKIWPRGFPLDLIGNNIRELTFFDNAVVENYSPIQQYLVDKNPDVDAIYRMTNELPFYFKAFRDVVTLAPNCWCPFNSQNTVWFKEAFPLMYLPSYCSARVADIWRSLVAQYIGWSNGWSVSFHAPTVTHERNQHDLYQDFLDEIPLYTSIKDFKNALETVTLRVNSEQRVDEISANMMRCYIALFKAGLLRNEELDLLNAWLDDVGEIIK